MKLNKTLFMFFSLVLISACSKIPDVISTFQTGLNNNDVTTVSGTISSTAQDYSALKNNNWSGLQSAMNGWKLNGTYAFTSIVENDNGDLSDVTCVATTTGSGIQACKFQMSNDPDFLFFKSWKIKQWTFGSSNAIYIQRIR